MSLVKRNTILFPNLINDILLPDWFGGIENTGMRSPAVNISEHEKGFELELAIPGYGKEDFTIEMDNDRLTIASKKETSVSENKKDYTRREFSYTSFERTFTLPETADPNSINAIYKDGILRLEVAKKEEALPKPKRLIEIQ